MKHFELLILLMWVTTLGGMFVLNAYLNGHEHAYYERIAKHEKRVVEADWLEIIAMAEK